MLVISCHSDTCQPSHRLRRLPDGSMLGHLDNFVGVHAVMLAYFSGRLDRDDVRIELTYGEERGCLGAMELLEQLRPEDLVVVVDVTAAPTQRDLSIEKCRDAKVRAFLDNALAGLSIDIHEGCPDPVSDCDETDIYVEKCPHVFFLGIPVQGGDYNAQMVRCRPASVHTAAEAICRIAQQMDDWTRRLAT